MSVEIFFFVNIHSSGKTECSCCDDKLTHFTGSHQQKFLKINFLVCWYDSKEHNQNHEF